MFAMPLSQCHVVKICTILCRESVTDATSHIIRNSLTNVFAMVPTKGGALVSIESIDVEPDGVSSPLRRCSEKNIGEPSVLGAGRCVAEANDWRDINFLGMEDGGEGRSGKFRAEARQR